MTGELRGRWAGLGMAAIVLAGCGGQQASDGPPTAPTDASGSTDGPSASIPASSKASAAQASQPPWTAFVVPTTWSRDVFIPGNDAEAGAFEGFDEVYSTAIGSEVSVGADCQDVAACPPERPAVIWSWNWDTAEWVKVTETTIRAMDFALNDGAPSPVELGTDTAILGRLKVETPEWQGLTAHEQEVVVAVAKPTTVAVDVQPGEVRDPKPDAVGQNEPSMEVPGSGPFTITVTLKPAEERSVSIAYSTENAPTGGGLLTTNADGVATVTIPEANLGSNQTGTLYISVPGTSSRAGASGSYTVHAAAD